MSIVIEDQKAARRARALPFCYLCGAPLGAGDSVSDDHVPPQAVFLPEDRDFPITLSTHRTCNVANSPDDQVVGYLIGILHGQRPDPKHSKIRVGIGHLESGALGLAVGGFDLRRIIRRWIRGFHAALYQEPLPDGPHFMTFPPLPEMERVGRQVRRVPVPQAVVEFVKELKRNRATSSLDRIVCRRGKCRYECVWTQADDGRWFCVYGLAIYDWTDLGDSTSFEARGCVGAYMRPSGGTPHGATRATRLLFSLSSDGRLDPFAS